MTEKPALDALEIAELCKHNAKLLSIQIGQTEHRINIIQQWDINPGDNVLELGCGQGDTTVALAAAVGEQGHVTALDPADLDYGNPFTLGQAQSHLKDGPLGSRINFVQVDPIDYLQALPSNPSGPKYTRAILAHCIFYFSSPAVLEKTLSLLGTHAQRICVAEYALTASQPTAQPHLLAVLTQASLECRKPASKSNIRTVLSPAAIKEVASKVGLKLVCEQTQVPPAGMFDGRWEVTHVLQDDFVKEVEESVRDERERGVVFALRDATRATSDLVKSTNSKLSTMDVWVATFVHPNT